MIAFRVVRVQNNLSKKTAIGDGGIGVMVFERRKKTCGAAPVDGSGPSCMQVLSGSSGPRLARVWYLDGERESSRFLTICKTVLCGKIVRPKGAPAKANRGGVTVVSDGLFLVAFLFKKLLEMLVGQAFGASVIDAGARGPVAKVRQQVDEVGVEFDPLDVRRGLVVLGRDEGANGGLGVGGAAFVFFLGGGFHDSRSLSQGEFARFLKAKPDLADNSIVGQFE